ncbi:hypothetical protein [Marinobacter sp. V034]|uniref:hypothetical protein n=1 Tax=Marinobacter sp. V034 TaxID=3459610 RepID=UPI004043C023
MNKGLLLALGIAVFGCSALHAAPIVKVRYPHLAYQETVEFQTGEIGHLQIPLDVLSNARIGVTGGLVFMLADGASFSVKQVTGEQAGFPGANMHDWPRYLFSVKRADKGHGLFAEEWVEVERKRMEQTVDPYEIRIFSTHRGTGYWAIGKQHSMIVLTGKDVRSRISVIRTTDMPEELIMKAIINGVI